MVTGKVRSFYQGDVEDADSCDVVIRDSKITVSYMLDGEAVIWKGVEQAPGHFHLSRQGTPWSATFHRWPLTSLTLVGTWVEDHQMGSWILDLDDDPDDNGVD